MGDLSVLERRDFKRLISVMKQKIVLAAIAALGLSSIALPAQAARLKWNVDYTGFFSSGASIFGSFEADETAADDGIVSDDEFTAWSWSWSGDSTVAAFTLSSDSAEIATPADGGSSFYVDGTPNLPFAGLDQGLFVSDSGEQALDLEFLLVEDFANGAFTSGSSLAGAAVTVSDPEPVPEPATLLSLLAVAGAVAATKRQRQLG